MTCNCNTWRRWVLLAALVALAFGMAREARAQGVYFSTESVLTTFFSSSERVSYVTIDTGTHRAELKRVLGYLPPKASYIVYVAKTGAHIDGYALVDEQLGQHLPITIATKVSPAGIVERTEVMVYRERYGEEIRNSRFRDQFSGKSADDAVKSGDDVVAISGATISSSSMAIAVKRAAALARIAAAESQATAGVR